MEDHAVEILKQRLDPLEHQNQRWRYTVSALVAAAAGTVRMGQALPASRTIEAERLVLKRPDGSTRALLGPLPDGSAGLAFSDDEGKRRAGLGVWRDGSASLDLNDQDEMPRVALSVEKGKPTLGLSDREGRVRAALRVLGDGSLRQQQPEGRPSAP